jgi:Fe(3+) dicitrate transport protein
LNTELGFRFDKGALRRGYRILQQFLDLQGSDSMSGGGAGTGDLFNAGAATVKGIELLATYDVIDNREKIQVTCYFIIY